MTERVAVVLFNLGGPDSLAAVRPFLYNLFSDPDIFQFPLGRWTRKLFAALIAYRRAPVAAEGYAAIGGSSPLLANTEAQALALQRALAAGFAPSPDVIVCMRYWRPRADDVVAHLKQGNYTRIVMLPLYPQYSRTTTGSAFNDFRRACAAKDYRPELRAIEHWYDQPDYLDGIVETLRAELGRFPDPTPDHTEVLFSAHGLPQKIVDAGDPYERHVRATYELVRAKIGWPNITLCYQSRVGPLAWLRPYTDDVIRAQAARGAKQILVYPIAFVSDHVETLYELGIMYADIARTSGIEHYRVAPALNAHPRLIRGLTTLVAEALR